MFLGAKRVISSIRTEVEVKAVTNCVRIEDNLHLSTDAILV